MLPDFWASQHDGLATFASENESSKEEKAEILSRFNIIHSTQFFCIMNLPEIAIDFLDAFAIPTPKKILPEGESMMSESSPINVRCYCFIRRNQEDETSVRKRVDRALGLSDSNSKSTFGCPGQKLRISNWEFRFVRNVAPYKDMYCIEFKIHFQLTQPDVSVAKARSICTSVDGYEGLDQVIIKRKKTEIST
ncbi:unnamed protein product [Protopolystoma xenopodis]|uniref:Uncharacterized protein n=1 Tax=Protopolystoma xenopodis TaxID=117903 RepID=A0A3S4ZMC9_9PLAT|nr:unnamed protein product [Protopolystoma xenopodis]